MPLYEFECRDCGRRFEALVRDATPPCCPGCEGQALNRMLSAFAVSSASTRATARAAAGRRNARLQRDKAIADHEHAHDHHE